MDSFLKKGVKSDLIGLTFVNPSSTGLARKTMVRFHLERYLKIGVSLALICTIFIGRNRERFVLLYLCFFFFFSRKL